MPQSPPAWSGSGVVNDTHALLLRALQEAGEAREALNDSLQAARTHITAHFALDERQRVVRDSERQPNKRARAQARRSLFAATLARSVAACYCLAYVRALMHLKLVVLQRARVQEHASAAAGASGGGGGDGIAPGAARGGADTREACGGGGAGAVGGGDAAFLSLLDGPFASVSWVAGLCLCVEVREREGEGGREGGRERERERESQ